jgi:hypothetical protein
MGRSKRALTILLAGALLPFFLANWTAFLEEINPAPLVLGFLLLVCLTNVLLRFTVQELLLFALIMVPFLYSSLRFFSGLPSPGAFLLVLRCGLALAFCRLILSFLESIRPAAARTALGIVASIAVPVLWSVLLLDQSILFSLSLPAVSGVFLYYLRGLKDRG